MDDFFKSKGSVVCDPSYVVDFKQSSHDSCIKESLQKIVSEIQQKMQDKISKAHCGIVPVKSQKEFSSSGHKTWQRDTFDSARSVTTDQDVLIVLGVITKETVPDAYSSQYNQQKYAMHLQEQLCKDPLISNDKWKCTRTLTKGYALYVRFTLSDEEGVDDIFKLPLELS